jgi:MFS family permease
MIVTIPDDVEDSPATTTPSEPLSALDEKALTDDTDTMPNTLSKAPSIADQLPLRQEILFVATVVLAQFTTQVGLGQTLAILPIIGRSLNLTNEASLPWLVAGYSLTVGSFILISGRFGDIFGWKRMFIGGFAWFAVWSAVSGLAVYEGKVLFVFARVLAGIGPAITLPNGLALLGASYEAGRRKDMVCQTRSCELALRGLGNLGSFPPSILLGVKSAC